jgi:hypothetical protein
VVVTTTGDITFFQRNRRKVAGETGADERQPSSEAIEPSIPLTSKGESEL